MKEKALVLLMYHICVVLLWDYDLFQIRIVQIAKIEKILNIAYTHFLYSKTRVQSQKML